ncbi:PREDICTED: zinc transporter 5-like isoform X1 [Nelumbo nucifera]|uniref:Zinc transporter 5-like isoform X1 n=3 Tax=Nelumbo nucifera TaxID=4432 RepID=A0A1U8Q6N1_NELNU|nr:PREDICTED: zinc transporter 5-like isoform X1 [Nelumbo nucifera]DAD44039.1 TPA_asm: hypothetical protein HUJ06_002269 [Nelumbo nucifera]
MSRLPTCSFNFLKISTLLLLLFLVLLPSSVSGECTCDAKENNRGTGETIKYKVAGIASILISGAIGVCIPVLGKAIPALHPENDIFFIIKAFAAGVILATGFIHILPNAFEKLTSPCLKGKAWQNFPFTGFIAMMSGIGTLMVDTLVTGYYKRSNFSKAQPLNGDVERAGEPVDHVHVHTHATHGHAHGSNSTSSDLLRHRIISQVLELGIVVHSVIIGISLGTSESSSTIKPLIAALSFHQFFEGIGLGGCITQARIKSSAVAIMAVFFSLTTPVGIAVGIGITNVYDANSSTSLSVEGVFDSASSGILIYMALVDLLAADFMDPKMQSNGRLQIIANISLLFGAACMSILAYWA